MKKILRWLIYLTIALLLLIGIAFLSMGKIVKTVAETRIKEQTGMDAQIGKFSFDYGKSAVQIENFKLTNPPEFGGKTFLNIPELRVELDTDALQTNRLHLKMLRLNIAEVHIVEDQDGRKNTDLFQKRKKPGSANPEARSTNKIDQIDFAGIDRLEITLGRASYTSDKHPDRNFDHDIGLKNRVFTDIQNEKDLEAVGVVLMMQSGFGMILQKLLLTPQSSE